MRAWIIQSWLRLQSSYYFIPALMGFGAVLLGLLTTIIDLRYQSEIRDLLGWFFASTVLSARSVLTTIAASMISVAAVTFSLTMVAVTTAAGQYGPRLIGNFMRDRANQVTLGTFVSTFLYCIVVLKSVSEEIAIDAQSTVGLTPSLSVLVALLLTLISVGVLIFFVHHIPETLNAGSMTGRLSTKLISQIETGRYPNSSKIDATQCDRLGDPFDSDLTQTVRSTASGYIQAISLRGLVEWSQENDMRVRLHHIPGEFIMMGDAIMDVIADDTQKDFDRDLFSETIAPKLLTFLALGRERTEHQNLLFLGEELVEIAARALSPGVNDPFTAINCIHWFGDICLAMMDAPNAPACLLDEQGTPRIWTRSVEFDALCSVLFGQTRQYISADENGARETLQVLYHLLNRSSDVTRPSLQRQIDALHAAISESTMGRAQKDRLKGGPPYTI
ncbi:DUF2254 domain-containing protein [Algimonas porphyrae]|uniref:DUF2254 domain-containing protein n=1 Tax=Algimonas porphyrae TaxID=1128113 RepID=A0ABQ5V2I5_9PROT|nr:DUF2254 domain-containing protein [Algimonas porphyrae]GLQ21159.1 hypothetical protein GCM10007854_21140 [Algimonas porphyrae]